MKLENGEIDEAQSPRSRPTCSRAPRDQARTQSQDAVVDDDHRIAV